MKIIFDFGANKGQNIKYFLKHADLVVAVEANPWLCEVIEYRYQTDIIEGRLIVENVCLCDSESSDQFLDFYINKRSHVNSSLLVPDKPEKFDKIRVFSKSPSSLIFDHIKQGDVVHYVKIDLEGFDVTILSDLFSNNIYPDFISAEFQTIEVFAQLILGGKYKAFKLGDFNQKSIIHNYDPKDFSSDLNSSGRFGPDLPGDWLNVDSFFHCLALTGKKGVDIHASKYDLPTELIDGKYFPHSIKYQLLILRIYILQIIFKNFDKQVKRFKRVIKRFIRY